MAKNSKYEFGDLVVVAWDDIVSDGSWLSKEKAEISPVTHCSSVGWFFNEDKDVLRLFASHNDMQDYSNLTIIPKGVITEIIIILKNED
jgi:hypothetical protein